MERKGKSNLQDAFIHILFYLCLTPYSPFKEGKSKPGAGKKTVPEKPVSRKDKRREMKAMKKQKHADFFANKSHKRDFVKTSAPNQKQNQNSMLGKRTFTQSQG